MRYSFQETTMRCSYACGSADHVISRRSFLGAAAAGLGLASGFSGMIQPAVSAELARRERQVLLVWLAGGASQLETWDPKPGTDTGGPFRSIETSVPGVRISELLPLTAKQMHRMALVRGVNTKEDDHGKGQYLMHTGRREAAGPGVPAPGVAGRQVPDLRSKPAAGLRPYSARRRRAERARGRVPRPQVRLARSGQRPCAGQHHAGRLARRRRRRGTRNAAAPPQRPLRPPPPHGRDRRLHDNL